MFFLYIEVAKNLKDFFFYLKLYFCRKICYYMFVCEPIFLYLCNRNTPYIYYIMNDIAFYTIKGADDFCAKICTLGAKIAELHVPNQKGEVKDVVLGFRHAEEWSRKELYFNAICGRVANRIKNGHFILDGRTYQLPANDGANCLHGGEKGFHAVIWEVVSHDAQSVKLHYCAKDGEEGFPGNVNMWVTYEMTQDYRLIIHYEATTDQPTIVAPTNHAYFNLAGEGSGSIREHLLQIHADKYTPFDDTFCPTGAIQSVNGTPMDWREGMRIGDKIDDVYFAHSHGIDNNWCLCENGVPKQLRHAATLQADGRRMECWTTMPGLQVYTGNYVEQNIGKSGRMYDKQHAICLEAQYWPDSIHHPAFPSIVLRPNEKLDEVTEYRF